MNDKLYVDKIKDKITHFKENNEISDLGLAWDVLKCDIRGETISYASFKAKTQREYENKLTKSLENYEKESPLNKEEYDNYVY